MLGITRKSARAALLTAGLSVCLSPGLFAQDHDHDNDRDRDRNQASQYYGNPWYQTGNQEGYEDYQRKQQRKRHHHKFKDDDDRRAHDYGYQSGWTGTRYTDRDRDRDRDHDHDDHH